jgi:hypothetical protein
LIYILYYIDFDSYRTAHNKERIEKLVEMVVW